MTVSLDGLGSMTIVAPQITWGDLKITAERGDYNARARTLKLTGQVVVVRGDERIEGMDLLFSGFAFGAAPSAFTFREARLISPPFSLTAGTLAFAAGETGRTVGERVRFSPSVASSQELVLQADRITSDAASGRLIFDNATFRLYGARILTVRRVSLRPSSDQSRQPQSLSLPASFRQSRLVGSVLGVHLPFSVQGVQGTALAELTSRQGLAYAISLRRSLIGPPPVEPTSTSILSSAPTSGGTLFSRIRPWITARPAPTYDTPRLGYQDILSTAPVVPRLSPLNAPSATLKLNINGKREFVRRNASLLLSRTPELELEGRVPHPSGSGALLYGIGVGNFTEQRLRTESPLLAGHYTSPRVAYRLGAELPTLRLADLGRVRAQVSHAEQRYQHQESYRVDELRLASDYALAPRAGLGVGLIARSTAGKSPFLWDTVEAPSEGHLRSQVALGSVTLAALGRWDLRARTLFDTEFAVGVRGKVLEPRFSYRSQNKQFGFTITVPGLAGL